MKILMAIAMLAATTLTQAQTAQKIIIAKGKTINMHSAMTMNMDLGMGMDMANNSNNNYSIQVLDVNDQTITIASTLTRMTMSVDAMGNQTTYDSDKADDKKSEIGQSIPEKMFLPDTVQIDRLTGKIINREKAISADADANPLDGMMQAFGNGNNSTFIQDLFFIIPAGIKTGNQWQDSIVEKGLKKKTTYTLTSIEKEMATVSISETSAIDTESEVQGMTMQINMNGTTKGSILFNTKTGMVEKKSNEAELNGSIEMMGQSNPISSKTTTTLLIQH